MRARFRQRDLERIVRAVLKAGIDVQRIEVSADGRFVVCADNTAHDPVDEFTEWKRRHADTIKGT